MSSVLDFYADRLERVECDRGFVELGLVLRRGKTQDPYTISDHKNFFFPLGSQIMNGDLITRIDHDTKDQYIVVAKQIGDDNVAVQGKRINTHINIYKLVDKYDSKHKKIGVEEVLTEENVPSYTNEQVASMRSYDAGLLESCTRFFFTKQGLDCDTLYRVKFYGANYEVVGIAKEKYRDMWVIQVKEDARK